MLESAVQANQAGGRPAPCCPYLHITKIYHTTPSGEGAPSRRKDKNEVTETEMAGLLCGESKDQGFVVLAQ